MSNALYNQAMLAEVQPTDAAAVTTPSPEMFPAWSMALLSMGIVLTLVWIARRIAYPHKFALTGTPARSNRIHPLHVLCLLAGTLLLTSISRQLLTPLVADQNVLDTITLGIYGLVLLAGGLIVGHICFDLGIKSGMGLTLRHWRTGTIRGVIACLIALAPCWGILWLTGQVINYFELAGDPGHPVIHAFNQASWPWQVAIFMLPVIIAPLMEEVVFRGLLQSMVRQYTRRPWVAILVTTAIFAAMHLRTWTTIPSLVVFSIILGYNYERTGRLLPSIVAHAAFNAIGMLQAL